MARHNRYLNHWVLSDMAGALVPLRVLSINGMAIDSYVDNNFPVDYSNARVGVLLPTTARHAHVAIELLPGEFSPMNFNDTFQPMHAFAGDEEYFEWLSGTKEWNLEHSMMLRHCWSTWAVLCGSVSLSSMTDGKPGASLAMNVLCSTGYLTRNPAGLLHVCVPNSPAENVGIVTVGRLVGTIPIIHSHESMMRMVLCNDGKVKPPVGDMRVVLSSDGDRYKVEFGEIRGKRGVKSCADNQWFALVGALKLWADVVDEHADYAREVPVD